MRATKEQLAMADIFRSAANQFLSTDFYDFDQQHEYSCHALCEASGFWPNEHCAAIRLVHKLGCPTFDSGYMGEEWQMHETATQGARFLWLHFVAEGLERGEIEL